VGYITRGRGVSVHRADCSNVKNNLIDGDARLIDVSWYRHTSHTVAYLAEITVKAHDRSGLLIEITNVIGESRVPLRAINARTGKDLIAVVHLTLEITHADQLDRMINRLSSVRDVYEISRNK
jgi:GTP pyrophosphokinase